MKHAVIFDIDGTLLDSSSEDDRMYRDAVRNVLGDVTLRRELAYYDRVTDTGILLQILADNGLAENSESMQSVKKDFFGRLRAFVSSSGPFCEMPGAKSVLHRLSASASHRVAIATGGWRRSAEIKLQTSGFQVDAIPLATSDDAIERTEIMRVALSALNEKFATVTYFGDGEWDKEACSVLGWTFCPVGSSLGGIESFDGLYTD